MKGVFGFIFKRRMKNNSPIYLRYHRIIIVFTAFALLFSISLSAQENKLNLKIKLDIKKGNMEHALITISRDGQPYRIIDPNKGKYKLELELNSDFSFVFTKLGYITKTVIIDTHIPKGREEEYFNEFIADVTLEPQPEDKIITYSQPVGKIKYSNPSGDFDFDNDYTATAKIQLEKDKEKAVPKPKEPAPNPRPEPPVTAKVETPPSKPVPIAVKQPEYKSTPEPKKIAEVPVDPPAKPIHKDTEERIVQKDRLKITLVTVKVSEKEYVYRKEEYSWGGTYFYRDDKNITESAFLKETE